MRGLLVRNGARLMMWVFLGFVCSTALQKPLVGWDALAYVGCTLSYDIKDSEELHRQSYRHIQERVSEAEFAQLTKGAYRRAVYLDHESFGTQLGMYHVKPLFIWLLYALYRMGFSVLDGLQWINLGSILLSADLSLLWLQSYLPAYRALFFALCLFFGARLLGLARLTTPDALSTYLTLLSVYLICERQRTVLGLLVLSSTVLARSNNIVFVLSLLGIMGIWTVKEAQFEL